MQAGGQRPIPWITVRTGEHLNRTTTDRYVKLIQKISSLKVECSASDDPI